MDKPLKKLWIEEKPNTYVFYACRYPYTTNDIIKEGVPYEVWVTLECIGQGVDK